MDVAGPMDAPAPYPTTLPTSGALTGAQPGTAGAAAADDDRTTGEPAQKRARSNEGGSSAGATATATASNGTSNGTSGGISPSQRLYSCGKCSKSYARLDHLSRHVRMHTQEKPYACQICTKAFARADLLKRHTLGHSKDDPQAKPTLIQHSRVSQACEACAGLHLKCEEEKPCKRCTKKGIQCNYTPGFGPGEMHQSSPKTHYSPEQQPQQHHHQYGGNVQQMHAMTSHSIPPMQQQMHPVQTPPTQHRNSFTHTSHPLPGMQMTEQPSQPQPPPPPAPMNMDPALMAPQTPGANMFDYLRDKMMPTSQRNPNGVHVMDYQVCAGSIIIKLLENVVVLC